MKPIEQIDVDERMSVADLAESMRGAGFGARRIGEAVEILRKMKKDNCKIFFGFAGALVPGGMRNIVTDMLNKGYIDVFVTTGANLTHDLIEALGERHYQGSEIADDGELNKKKIDRIYDVFMKNSVYEKLEGFFEENWEEISKTENIMDFLWKIGSLIEDEKSILRVCYKKQIPIFCPAIADSGIGLMVWGRLSKGRKININVFEDMKEIIDIAWTSEKKGVVYVGGGVPKNFIQQSLQFSKGADYGIQITMDRPEHGGSSGANLKEGISWGKMKKDGRYVNVICDATIALPLIWAGVKN